MPSTGLLAGQAAFRRSPSSRGVSPVSSGLTIDSYGTLTPVESAELVEGASEAARASLGGLAGEAGAAGAGEGAGEGGKGVSRAEGFTAVTGAGCDDAGAVVSFSAGGTPDADLSSSTSSPSNAASGFATGFLPTELVGRPPLPLNAPPSCRSALRKLESAGFSSPSKADKSGFCREGD